jgi:peptidoglycan/LPS O-acetylase OafA/YrhL
MSGGTEGRQGFGYQPALDGLRAVAVMAVIFYHLGYSWSPGGFLGVDTFFVLSGFLITSLLLVEWRRHDRIDFRAFWVRRARRLLPALFIVLLAVAIWAKLVLRPDQLGAIRNDGLATLFYSANWRFVLSGQSYFALFSTASPFRHAWSLAIEEQFYLVWPLVVFACLWTGRGRLRVLAAVTAVGAVASIAAMWLLVNPSDPSRVYYGTDTRAHSLLIGVLLAIALTARPPQRAWVQRGVHVAGAVSFVLLIAAYATISDQALWMYHAGYALFAITAMVVVASAVVPGRSPVRALLSLPVLVWIGTISYGLYLWHWPLQVALTPQRVGFGGIRLDLLRIGLTFAFATVSFYLVERPIRRGVLSKRLALAATPVAVIGVASALVIASAGATPAPPSTGESVTQALGNLKVKATSHVSPTTTTTTTAPGGGAPGTDAGASDGSPAVDALPPSVPRVPPQSIVWAGDSVAGSLSDAIIAAGRASGITITDVSVPGCGLIAGLPAPNLGPPVAWAQTCSDNIPQIEQRAAAFKPDIITWLSSWEDSDRIVNGVGYKFGTPTGDAEVMQLIDQAMGRLTATGARVAIFTVAPPTTSSDLPPPTQDDITPILHLNALLRQYVSEHPQTTFLVDLAAMVCPTTPCSPTVDGVTPRPEDGRHFAGAGPAWVAPYILDALVAQGAQGG